MAPDTRVFVSECLVVQASNDSASSAGLERPFKRHLVHVACAPAACSRAGWHHVAGLEYVCIVLLQFVVPQVTLYTESAAGEALA